MSDLEETLKRAMPEETKHWIEEAAALRAALQEIVNTIPTVDIHFQGAVAKNIASAALMRH